MAATETLFLPSRLHPLPRIAMDPGLLRTALALIASLAVTLPALALDDRVLHGENVWLKPVKFQLALIAYSLTLGLFAGWLPRSVMTTPRMRTYWTIVSLCIIAEMIWIAGAAMFATSSHYNLHPVMAAIYGLMGVAAVTLTSGSLVLGLAYRRHKDLGLPPALHLSITLGLILTFLLTVPIAGTLSSLPDRLFGADYTGATVPFFGWSREIGDLGVSHFFATHALHVIPAIGLMAMALPPRRPAMAAVWLGAVAYTAFTIATFVQALRGIPFIS